MKKDTRMKIEVVAELPARVGRQERGSQWDEALKLASSLRGSAAVRISELDNPIKAYVGLKSIIKSRRLPLNARLVSPERTMYLFKVEPSTRKATAA